MIGISAKLYYESGSAQFTEIEKCYSVNFPGYNVSSVDTTSLANTDYAMTFEAGMMDPGEITFSCEYTTAKYVTLQGLVLDNIDWKVSGPTAASKYAVVEGHLTKLDVVWNTDTGTPSKIEGTIKCSGFPTLT